MSSTPLGQMLIAAVEDGARLWEVQHYIDEGAPLDETDTKGDTALIKAAAKNDSDLVEMLLLAGCDPNTPDRDGNTPLIRTVEFIKNGKNALEIIYDLLARGADPFKTNNQGHDLMHYAEKWKDSHDGIFEAVRSEIALRSEKNKPAAEKTATKPDHTSHRNLRSYLKIRGVRQ
ncbi:MAG: ankyrin repeat domain-containing protein [Micavibrio sp.]|nr:MAG: ankyrin repeat domain-containing protein [Micavibrio sp.]